MDDHLALAVATTEPDRSMHYPWVGITGIDWDAKNQRMVAIFYGRAFEPGRSIGVFGEGDTLPPPWDKWKVLEIDWRINFQTKEGRTEPKNVVIRNVETGEKVKLFPHGMPKTQPAATQRGG
ncbi:MAG TPA: hypothetical protein VK797_31130 [Tepidisphaeraceae bacterium]|nr:hypothetical protein [Tepidisphaeraceae bacterium]